MSADLRLRALQDAVAAAQERFLTSMRDRPDRIVSQAAIMINSLDAALRASETPLTSWFYFVTYRHQVLTVDGELPYLGSCTMTSDRKVADVRSFQALVRSVAEFREVPESEILLTGLTLLDGPQ